MFITSLSGLIVIEGSLCDLIASTISTAGKKRHSQKSSYLLQLSAFRYFRSSVSAKRILTINKAGGKFVFDIIDPKYGVRNVVPLEVILPIHAHKNTTLSDDPAMDGHFITQDRR